MSQPLKITVQAGSHHRKDCPVHVSLPQDYPLAGAADLAMQDEQGKAVPLQCEADGGGRVLHWILEDLPAGASRAYTVAPGRGGEAAVQLSRNGQQVDIRVGGALLASYVENPAMAKPYLGPVLTPDGVTYTRLDFESREHPHHRSVWVAIGDVNGVDFWNEPANNYGKQKPKAPAAFASGAVFGTLTGDNLWTSFKDKPFIDEKRTIRFYNTSAAGRIIDIDIAFRASYGKTEFGASKEAGPLGTRIAECMNGDHGGRLTNSYGAIAEAECWGRRAMWCDYSGATHSASSGQAGGRALGFAVFDNPANQHYPTYWHCRNGGLMAPNNFFFIGGNLLQPNEMISYRYRLYFHEGDAATAAVAERFHDYINPPKVSLA